MQVAQWRNGGKDLDLSGKYDEYLASDKPWSYDKVDGMVRRIDKARIPLTHEVVYEEGDGWYGMRCKAYDKGNPDQILDAIQLEQAVESIQDLTVKAATILSMYGWNEENIGAVLKGHRTGYKLVKEGVKQVVFHEQTKREGNL